MKIQDSGLPLFNVSNGKPLKNADDKIAKYNFLPGPVPPCRKLQLMYLYLVWSFLDLLIWLPIVTKNVNGMLPDGNQQKKREQRSTIVALSCCVTLQNDSSMKRRRNQGSRENVRYETLKQYNGQGSTKQPDASCQYPVFSPPQLSFPSNILYFTFLVTVLVTAYILRFLWQPIFLVCHCNFFGLTLQCNNAT